MNHIKAVLFDADGVLALPEEFFSQVYARSRGLNPEPFETFFKTQFPAARIGKADLKELIKQAAELWQWEGSVDDLLQLWFETEAVRNEPLLNLIQELRTQGTSCFMATNQDKYRGDYFRNVMFKNEFDGYFVSAELGVEKPTPEFFEAVIEDLRAKLGDIKPGEVAFFDDSAKNVEAAQTSGLWAHLYKSVDDVKVALKEAETIASDA